MLPNPYVRGRVTEDFYASACQTVVPNRRRSYYNRNVDVTVKIGEGGEITLPKGAADLKGGETLRVRDNGDGSLTLTPTDLPAVRKYTDEDLRVFARSDEVTPDLSARLRAFLK